jgi:hypothetical protein
MNSKFKFMLPLFVFALVLACSKDTPEPEVVIPPITGIDFTITTNEENPLQVGVTPTATGASSFKVYFDSVGAPTTFEETTGAIVTHTYPEVTATYTIKVVASNTNGAGDILLTKNHTVTVIPDTVLADFESVGPPYLVNDDTASIVDVDGPIGDNTSRLGKITNTNTAETNWEGVQIVNTKYIDLTDVSKRVISLDFYQETAATPRIGIKLQNALTTGVFDVEITKLAVGVEGWQTIEFDFGSDEVGNSYPNNENPTITLDQYQGIVLFIGFGENAAGVHYIDNLTGAAFGTTDVPDTDGDSVLDPVDNCRTESGLAENGGCPAGPVVAATAPTAVEADILSIYSDAYTSSVAITNYQLGWSTNASNENVEITAGENAMNTRFTSATGGYVGIELGSTFDATAYNAVHLDVWTRGLTSFILKIEGASGATEITVPITTTNAWESVIVPVASTVTDVNLVVLVSSVEGQVYTDNIYMLNQAQAARFTVTVPDGTTTVNFQSSVYGWDPGPVATDNGDGTWTREVSAADSTGNIEYKWIVDGVTEDIIALAVAGCSNWTQGVNLNTDYYSYGNRLWIAGSAPQSTVFNSCGAPASVRFTVTVPDGTTTVNFQSNVYGWDPGPVATDNGDGTWTREVSADDATGNVEYKWIVDGVTEDIIALAVAGCPNWVQGENLNTDYWSYGNRMWTPGSAEPTNEFNTCN